jgi:hypothetical protein
VARLAPGPLAPGYSVRRAFFSRSEAAFFKGLSEAVGGRFLIFSKVRLADICDDPADQGALNRILPRHVDFVLCEPITFRILAAVELDGWSHSQPKQIASDKFKNDFFKRIGVPLLRYSVNSQPDPSELARSIAAVVRSAG